MWQFCSIILCMFMLVFVSVLNLLTRAESTNRLAFDVQLSGSAGCVTRQLLAHNEAVLLRVWRTKISCFKRTTPVSVTRLILIYLSIA